MKSFNDVLDARAKAALAWLLLATVAAAAALEISRGLASALARLRLTPG